MKVKDKFFTNELQKLLEVPEIRRLEFYTHHKITNRLYHSIDVSYKSYKMLKRFTTDKQSLKEIIRASMVHDLFFYDDCKNHEKHLTEHPKTALENASKIFDLTEKEKDIILSHMYGVNFECKPQTLEAKIVCVVDKWVSLNEVCLRLVRRNKQILVACTAQ